MTKEAVLPLPVFAIPCSQWHIKTLCPITKCRVVAFFVAVLGSRIFNHHAGLDHLSLGSDRCEDILNPQVENALKP